MTGETNQSKTKQKNLSPVSEELLQNMKMYKFICFEFYATWEFSPGTGHEQMGKPVDFASDDERQTAVGKYVCITEYIQ